MAHRHCALLYSPYDFIKEMKQGTFTDMEYSGRKKKTRREEFLKIMDAIIPWDA